MKVSLVTLFAVLAVISASKIEHINLEVITAFNYLARIGLRLAEEVRKTEETEESSHQDSVDRQPFITNGTVVGVGDNIPFQAGLVAQISEGQSICGGSLISVNSVVTAAHCWFDGVTQASSFTVVLGSKTIFFGGIRLVTNQVITHSKWNPTLVENDVAIVKLPNNVELTSNIQTIALPSGVQLLENFAGENAIACGFGRIADGLSGSILKTQALRKVTLPVITNAVCSRTYSNIPSSNICTSGVDGKSTCRGDSGGPLFVQRNGLPLLIGITSFGAEEGCQFEHPAVFSRVTSFVTFIKANM